MSSVFDRGEIVVAAVGHRDYILVFGSYGTVVRVWWDEHDRMFKYAKEMEM